MAEDASFCPYKGLTHYSEEDAPYFFGREAEREIISANLLAYRLTLVYGPSGVGKSSVLRAGVAHHLRAAAKRNLKERGSPEYAITVFNTWRDDPVGRLLETVSRDVEELSGDPAPVTGESLADSLAGLARRAGGELLIVLDQFEEYFLYHPDEDGPGTFAWEFPRALAADVPVGFLLSIREDSLARLDRFKGRITQLFDNYLRIDNLDERAARAAIVQPLREYNRRHGTQDGRVAIERSLVRQVIHDVGAGSLQMGDSGRGTVGRPANRTRIETPYLQLIMTRLWEEERAAQSRVLRLKTLVDLGSAEQIVRTHLDSALHALSEEERDTAANIFNHLVTPSRTKIAHTVTDLAEFAAVDRRKAEELLEKLSSGTHRILCPVAPAPDQPTNLRYQIFHDVLAAGILEWRRKREEKRALAAASVREQEQRARAEREARSARRFRFVAAGFGVALVLMIAVAAYALVQRNAARQAQELAEQRDVEKLALAQRAEQQRLQAEAERAQKQGFATEAAKLRAQADQHGQRASAAERLAADQGLKVASASRETENLRAEAQKLRYDNDGLRKQLDTARGEIAALQKTVDDLKAQLKAKLNQQKDQPGVVAKATAPKETAPIERPTRPPKGMAIGISRYEAPKESLRWASEDAELFGRHLTMRGISAEVLLDENATAPAIRRKVKAMLENALPSDEITLFLSAHILDRDRIYILPVEAEPQDLRSTAIAVDELSDWMARSAGRVVLIADLFNTEAISERRQRSMMEALTNRSVNALVYIHTAGSFAEEYPALARSLLAAGAKQLKPGVEDVRRAFATVAGVKLIPFQNGSLLIHETRTRRGLANLVPVMRGRSSASGGILSGDLSKTIADAEAVKNRSAGEYASLSQRLLIALEERGNRIIRLALRAYESPVTNQDYERCAEDFGAALKIAPQAEAAALESKQLFCHASLLLAQGDRVTAAQILRRAATIAPESGYLYNAMGMAFLGTADYDRARMLFTQASRLAPNWVYPVRNLAQLYVQRGELLEAGRAYSRAIELAPSGALLYEFGEVERQRGDLTNAQRLLSQSILYSPDDSRPYVALARLQMSQGQTQRARDLLSRSLHIARSSEALHALALLHQQSGQPEEAIRVWRELIQFAPAYLAGYLGLGELLTTRGRDDEAADVYARALEVHPISPELLKLAAGAMVRIGKPADAEVNVRSILRLRPRDAEALAMLGDIQTAAGKPQEAAESYASALANAPSDRLRKSIQGKLAKLKSPP